MLFECKMFLYESLEGFNHHRKKFEDRPTQGFKLNSFFWCVVSFVYHLT